MNPVCFSFFGYPVHWYGVLMAVGFSAGLMNWIWLGQRRGWNMNFCSDLLFWVMVAGILGARIAYVAHEFPHYRVHPLEVFAIHKGGLIYYGGFLLAAAALVVFARMRRVRLLDMLDFVVTSVPLAHAFGRVGCFLNGCCYGSQSGLPWAVRYPAQSSVWWDEVMAEKITRFAPESQAVHPVQLYEAVFNVVLYLAIVFHYRHRRREGSTVALYLLTYPVGRFLLELLRGDARAQWCRLSVSQWVSLGLIALGLAIWGYVRTTRADVPTER